MERLTYSANLEKRDKFVIALRKFEGKPVKVVGMWTGDFIGTLDRVGLCTADFTILESMATGDEAPGAGKKINLWYHERMTIIPAPWLASELELAPQR